MQILQDLLGISYKVEGKVESRFRFGVCFWNNWDLTILTTMILDSCKVNHQNSPCLFFDPFSRFRKTIVLESYSLVFFPAKIPSRAPPKNPPKHPNNNLFGVFSPFKTLPPSTRFRPWPQLLVALPEWQREGPGRLWKVPFDTSKMMVFCDRKTSWELGAPTFFETSNKTYIFWQKAVLKYFQIPSNP